MRGAQIPLAMTQRARCTFDSFVVGDNAGTLAAVQAGEEQLYVCGPADCGKSHLLLSALRMQPGGVLLDGTRTDAETLALLEGAEHVPWLGIDDVARLGGQRDIAVSLARVLDRRHADSLPTVVTARLPPGAIPELLPDLVTRLSRMSLHRVKPLDEATLRDWLMRAAAARGLQLADAAAQWLLQQLPRRPGELEAALHQLDTAALTAKRHHITLPFVRSVMGSRSA